ncbi:hypothetical protein ACPPVW_03770 [Leifsonia sp. McL0607]|uniref:hypothetical protein n=1 Tax=Leifsonia sp. McL0607 TaxID=3415672 RepID=UPI003CE77A24
MLGAAGGVEHNAVQLAVARGALVTGVCSGRKADLVGELGATETIRLRWPSAGSSSSASAPFAPVP